MVFAAHAHDFHIVTAGGKALLELAAVEESFALQDQTFGFREWRVTDRNPSIVGRGNLSRFTKDADQLLRTAFELDLANEMAAWVDNGEMVAEPALGGFDGNCANVEPL